MDRLLGRSGDALIYRTPGPVKQIKVFAFSESDKPSLSFGLSQDNQSCRSISAKIANYHAGEGDYAYWVPMLYELKGSISPNQYVKIEFEGTTQISRVEIYYGK